MHCPYLEPAEKSFLYQIQKELSLQTSGEVVKRVTAVLHALRQTLTIANANILINQLPDFLRLTFIANWRPEEEIVSVNHLDELVSLIQQRDESSGSHYFHGELQILAITIITLKKLLAFNQLNQFEGIGPLIRKQLDEISIEAITA